MNQSFEWIIESRQELAAFLKCHGWEVIISDSEADLEIARDCRPEDVVLSRDSDLLAYKQVVTIWRPTKGRQVMVYHLPDVLKTIGLSRGQLTALAIVSKNDYSSNVRSLGCISNFGIIKHLDCGGKIHA